MTNRSTEGIQQTTTQKKILASEKAEREGGAEGGTEKEREKDKRESKRENRERAKNTHAVSGGAASQRLNLKREEEDGAEIIAFLF